MLVTARSSTRSVNRTATTAVREHVVIFIVKILLYELLFLLL